MKLLLDQGLPRSTASLLRDAGIDAIHTGEIGFATAEDVAIIERAQQENRVIVTLDADFHTLLALSGSSSPSIIRIRIERLRAEVVTDLVLTILNQWSIEFTRGAALTVQSGRIRLRRLPLQSNLG
jgi:predicted nuclease of predicted toxin-antitoxin system